MRGREHLGFAFELNRLAIFLDGFGFPKDRVVPAEITTNRAGGGLLPPARAVRARGRILR